ncbi:MAG: hypothetical protein R3343_14670 [Nitriliruptorales bacterium]|nr:hypothetical protein [Nitriliruptorales bacterium]
MLPRVLTLLAVGLLVVACGGDDAPDVGDDPAPSPSPSASPDVGVPAGLTEEAEGARQLVADETGARPADVEVVEAETVTWRNGALGCPQPDQSYTQALVDGYRFLLRAEGQEFHVHGRTGDAPFICENPQEPSGGGTG